MFVGSGNVEKYWSSSDAKEEWVLSVIAVLEVAFAVNSSSPLGRKTDRLV